jgi:hypothetical protein
LNSTICKTIFAGRGSNFSGLSDTGIFGPRRVVEAELFAGREWRDEISADGVRSQVSMLSRRALLVN